MQYPESTSVGVVQAWPEPGSLKPRGGHHLEPQGSRAYSSAVPRVIFLYPASRAPRTQAGGGGLPVRLPIPFLKHHALNDLPHLKRRLRAQLRTERDALSTAQRVACADRALKHLLEWEPWQRARTVASYLPHESEFDPTPLMSVAIQQGKCVACPRVVDQSCNFTDGSRVTRPSPPSAGFCSRWVPPIGWRRRTSTCLSRHCLAAAKVG